MMCGRGPLSSGTSPGPGVRQPLPLGAGEATGNQAPTCTPDSCAARQLRVDRLRGKNRLDHHRARTTHARASPGVTPRDAEVLGRQRGRPVVDDLTDAGQQVLAGLRKRSADDNHRRVQQV
jgi:hypothetical protein